MNAQHQTLLPVADRPTNLQVLQRALPAQGRVWMVQRGAPAPAQAARTAGALDLPGEPGARLPRVASGLAAPAADALGGS